MYIFDVKIQDPLQTAFIKITYANYLSFFHNKQTWNKQKEVSTKMPIRKNLRVSIFWTIKGLTMMWKHKRIVTSWLFCFCWRPRTRRLESCTSSDICWSDTSRVQLKFPLCLWRKEQDLLNTVWWFFHHHSMTSPCLNQFPLFFFEESNGATNPYLQTRTKVFLVASSVPFLHRPYIM